MKVKLEEHYWLIELYQQSSLQEALQLQFLFVMEKSSRPMFKRVWDVSFSVRYKILTCCCA